MRKIIFRLCCRNNHHSQPWAIKTMLLKSLLYIFIALTSFTFGVAHSEQRQPLRVRYPASDHIATHMKRVQYSIEILELALKKSGHPYQLEKIRTPLLSENRSKNNLSQKKYDVHWLTANQSLESELIPIPIPLCKGLMGWRLLFIRAESQQKFSAIKNLNDLGKLIAANGHDWPESKLFEENQLNQRLATNWKSIFLMLGRERVDYISRSALEIFQEENAFPQLNIAIESDLVIHYPAAYYFYVDKSNQGLADIIESGLKIAIADGSFDEVFNRYFSNEISRMNVAKRRLIEIPTSNKFKRHSNPEYWFSL